MQDVKSLKGVIEEMEDPFSDDSGDLLALDSMDLADIAVIDIVRWIEKHELKQCGTDVKERLVNQTKPIADPIKRNNLPLFSRAPL